MRLEDTEPSVADRKVGRLARVLGGRAREEGREKGGDGIRGGGGRRRGSQNADWREERVEKKGRLKFYIFISIYLDIDIDIDINIDVDIDIYNSNIIYYSFLYITVELTATRQRTERGQKLNIVDIDVAPSFVCDKYCLIMD